jgi:hypothetical protein
VINLTHSGPAPLTPPTERLPPPVFSDLHTAMAVERINTLRARARRERVAREAGRARRAARHTARRAARGRRQVPAADQQPGAR